MNIEMSEGWNDKGNHDSKYDESMVKALIEQCAELSADVQTSKMPERIGLFTKHCLRGEKTIWVTKGIHQRWGDINASGELKKEADPHIQVQFEHRFGLKPIWIAIHVCLSEEQQGVRTLGDGRKVIQCSWKAVGLTTKRGNLVEQWPAYFSQEVGNIQTQGAGRRGLKRRYSVGLLVPATL